MLVVGVDACKTGWIAVVLGDGADPHAHYLPVIESLQSVAPNADAVAIAIPIGLPTIGRRDADVQAREFLGDRRNSVFFTPVREAITAETHALATRAAFESTGTGISQQAYADRVIRAQARSFADPPRVDASGQQVAIWA